VASHSAEEVRGVIPYGPIVDLISQPLPPLVSELMGPYIAPAELLGQRIGELHLALASDPDDPAFRPEPFTPHYQRSIYQRMRTDGAQALQLLRKRLHSLPEGIRPEAETILLGESEIQRRFRSVIDHKIGGLRIRLHGDLHLGQILYTGKDFYVIDFEGEPSRPLSERRIKRSALRDVAGMLRSFHYAGYAVLLGQAEGVNIRREDVGLLELGARLWYIWSSVIFLRSYLTAASSGHFLPKAEELQVLLDAYILDKALYELTYELNSRPNWVQIPIRGMLELLGSAR
jgi:maltose alpha-D-glucosyltransferase/alpha-amylase